MKKKVEQHHFEGAPFEIKLPARPDYARISRRQLLSQGRKMYTGLQQIWSIELRMPEPNWDILESCSRQMVIFEVRCPEVCDL